MNNSIIIGVSGKKRSGKDTLCKYLQAWYYCNLEQKDFTFKQQPDGEIIFKNKYATISFSASSSDMLQDYDCKVYSFADPLKRFCIDVMGLTWEQCYGEEKDKNSLTKYKWDNLPLEIRIKYSNDSYGEFEDINGKKISIEVPRYGFMTAREILQVVGSEIFRDMFDRNIWVNATIGIIKKENKKIVFIADVRFESEINAIMSEKNGYIIRLRRIIENDGHTSETQLDNFDFSQFGNRCLVIDNRNMKIEEQCKIGLEFFKKIIKNT